MAKQKDGSNNKKPKKKYYPSSYNGDVSKEEWERMNNEFYGDYDILLNDDRDDDITEELDFDHYS